MMCRLHPVARRACFTRARHASPAVRARTRSRSACVHRPIGVGTCDGFRIDLDHAGWLAGYSRENRQTTDEKPCQEARWDGKCSNSKGPCKGIALSPALTRSGRTAACRGRRPGRRDPSRVPRGYPTPPPRQPAHRGRGRAHNHPSSATPRPSG